TVDTVARVFAMVENIDENVGRLMAGLERMELDQDTLVLFMLDNGPNTRRYVGPMRGMKTEVHDGGVRSPLFVRWPDQLEAGRRVKQTAAHIDLMPTLLEAAGLAKPTGVEIDGQSLLPLMRGDKEPDASWSKRTLVLQAHRGTSSNPMHHVMVLQDKWKLVRPSGFHHPEPKDQTPFELYDLSDDPAETENLAEKQADVLKRLQAAYFNWHRAVVPKTFVPARIIVGTEHEPVTALTKQDWHPTVEGGWGKNGRWLVHAEQAGRYDATLLLREPAKRDSPVTLKVGSRSFQGEIKEGATSLRVEGVEAPAGDFEIIAVVGEGKQAQGPWQIEWAKR
ncbi:MAG: sulfatase/phosphatase domain-containing protein, partial [Planctomycetota bacterium]